MIAPRCAEREAEMTDRSKTVMTVLTETEAREESRYAVYRAELEKYCQGYAFQGADSGLRRMGADRQAEAIFGATVFSFGGVVR